MAPRWMGGVRVFMGTTWTPGNALRVEDRRQQMVSTFWVWVARRMQFSEMLRQHPEEILWVGRWQQTVDSMVLQFTARQGSRAGSPEGTPPATAAAAHAPPPTCIFWRRGSSMSFGAGLENQDSLPEVNRPPAEYYANEGGNWKKSWLVGSLLYRVKSERENQILYISVYMWNLDKWDWRTHLRGRNRDTDKENGFADLMREWEGGTERVAKKHTLPYAKELIEGFCITQGLNLVLCDNLEGVRGRSKTEGTDVSLWLIYLYAVVWQKATQHCEAIILQLKINFKKIRKKKDDWAGPLVPFPN